MNKEKSTLLFSIPVLLSGFAGLMYEVLWLKKLGQLFGNTAYASSATLCAFFTGLALGSFLWGKWSKKFTNSLTVYALLELGIAASALLFLIIYKIYALLYTPLYSLFGHVPQLFTLVKFILSFVLLILPCFFMGGTMPVLLNAFVNTRQSLGIKASFLYAINTIGAALGAFATSFFLIIHFGIYNTLYIALILNCLVALFVWFFLRTRSQSQVVYKENTIPGSLHETPIKERFILGLAFVSGFLALGLEVLWIRMFALVLHNSVYSFSVVLIIFIIALALGSLVANRLCNLKTTEFNVLCLFFILSGLSVGLTPTLFKLITQDLSYSAPDAGWYGYIFSIVIKACAVFLVPGIIIGTIFPYLLKVSQNTTGYNTGRIIGNVSSINTIGSAIGATTAGFVLLPFVGLWVSVILIACLYLCIALLLALRADKQRVTFIIVSVVGVISLVTWLNPRHFPLIKINDGEELLDMWEGSHGSVAVVKGGNNLTLVLDNYYTLGDLSAYKYERMQAHLPLLLHHDPKNVFFLGMGTGITAGAALLHPISSVTTCELVPEVITAAQKYFSPYNTGLFTDKRSKVIAEDGRNFLLGTNEQYDVIVSDLFTPWGAGTGNLYTKEHFITIKKHLTNQGVLAQWLPLYQLSKREFDIIAKTMLEVFPLVTMWRGDLFAKDVIVVLIGHVSTEPVSEKSMIKQMKALEYYSNQSEDVAISIPLIFYGGNLSENKKLFDSIAINTDNRPIIEYLSPITHRNQSIQKTDWFGSYELLEFYDALREKTPPESDPFLATLSDEHKDAVHAGYTYFKGAVLKDDKKNNEAQEYFKQFFEYFSPDVAAQLQDLGFQVIGK